MKNEEEIEFILSNKLKMEKKSKRNNYSKTRKKEKGKLVKVGDNKINVDGINWKRNKVTEKLKMTRLKTNNETRI